MRQCNHHQNMIHICLSLLTQKYIFVVYSSFDGLMTVKIIFSSLNTSENARRTTFQSKILSKKHIIIFVFQVLNIYIEIFVKL